jgi:hypothetical protein
MVASVSVELAASQDGPVEFWGLTGASVCEVALLVAERVAREAFSAAGLEYKFFMFPNDLRQLSKKAVARRLADLTMPNTAPLMIQAKQEIGRAIRLRAEVQNSVHREQEDRDGPGTKGWFNFKGKPYKFSLPQWRILKCLWRKAKGVSTDRVLDAVYGHGADAKDEALKQVMNRLNDNLIAYELPFKVQTRHEHWTLVRLPS